MDNTVHKNEIIEQNIIDFKVVKTAEPKLKKNGEPKQTKNNATDERFVEPIRNKEDIAKIKEFMANDKNVSEYVRERNLLIFIIGINSGYRVSDIITLTWGDFFNTHGEFRERKGRKEKKTGKIKQLYINDSIKEAITRYIDKVHPRINQDDFIFKASKEAENHISDTTVSNMIKYVTQACNIKGNYNTHSLRKTFGYQLYMMLSNSENESTRNLALPVVQQELNHRNQSDTLRYLGLHYETRAKVIDKLNL